MIIADRETEMSRLHSTGHYSGRLKTRTGTTTTITTTTTMKRPKKERTQSAAALRDTRNSEEVRKNAKRNKRWKNAKKDPKNTEKFDEHKDEGRKQNKKQEFPFVIKKVGKGDTNMKQTRKKSGQNLGPLQRTSV